MHIEPDSLPAGHAGIAARLKKGPTIHSSAWIVPGATVVGDVTLAEESSVWYGAVLRGDINRIIIGPRSNVQDNAVVHLDTNYPTMVGALVTMGMKIPPGSLVLGSPAKIRRQLSVDEQKDIARWAWSYVETAKQFRESCASRKLYGVCARCPLHNPGVSQKRPTNV